MSDYIKEIADYLVNRYKTRNPFIMAEAMNIKLKFFDLGILNGFYMCKLRHRVIGINSCIPHNVQLLCCAHEIGHDQLHRDMARSMKCMQDINLFSSSRLEYQANLLAAHIIITDDMLFKYEHLGYTIHQIASAENVSPQLIELKFNLYNIKTSREDDII